MCVYIFFSIKREKEREREREVLSLGWGWSLLAYDFIEIRHRLILVF